MWVCTCLWWWKNFQWFCTQRVGLRWLSRLRLLCHHLLFLFSPSPLTHQTTTATPPPYLCTMRKIMLANMLVCIVKECSSMGQTGLEHGKLVEQLVNGRVPPNWSQESFERNAMQQVDQVKMFQRQNCKVLFTYCYQLTSPLSTIMVNVFVWCSNCCYSPLSAVWCGILPNRIL